VHFTNPPIILSSVELHLVWRIDQRKVNLALRLPGSLRKTGKMRLKRIPIK
jgi:hypothetical protein